ncbi:MAG: hypothetical protein K2F59_00510 [Eubacteriales bacterium]|nr:hypothetical protein [Eubacteriales bacterium]
MGRTSSAVKNRYNKKTYKRFDTLIKPELFERLEAYRNEKGLSRSQFLQLAIDKLEENGVEKREE